MRAVVETGLTLLRTDRGALFTLLNDLLETANQHSRAGGTDRRDLGAGLGHSIGREIATALGCDLQARRCELGMNFDRKLNSSEPRTGVVR